MSLDFQRTQNGTEHKTPYHRTKFKASWQNSFDKHATLHINFLNPWFIHSYLNLWPIQ